MGTLVAAVMMMATAMALPAGFDLPSVSMAGPGATDADAENLARQVGDKARNMEKAVADAKTDSENIKRMAEEKVKDAEHKMQDATKKADDSIKDQADKAKDSEMKLKQADNKMKTQEENLKR